MAYAISNNKNVTNGFASEETLYQYLESNGISNSVNYHSIKNLVASTGKTISEDALKVMFFDVAKNDGGNSDNHIENGEALKTILNGIEKKLGDVFQFGGQGVSGSVIINKNGSLVGTTHRTEAEEKTLSNMKISDNKDLVDPYIDKLEDNINNLDKMLANETDPSKRAIIQQYLTLFNDQLIKAKEATMLLEFKEAQSELLLAQKQADAQAILNKTSADTLGKMAQACADSGNSISGMLKSAIKRGNEIGGEAKK